MKSCRIWQAVVWTLPFALNKWEDFVGFWAEWHDRSVFIDTCNSILFSHFLEEGQGYWSGFFVYVSLCTHTECLKPLGWKIGTFSTWLGFIKLIFKVVSIYTPSAVHEFSHFFPSSWTLDILGFLNFVLFLKQNQWVWGGSSLFCFSYITRQKCFFSSCFSQRSIHLEGWWEVVTCCFQVLFPMDGTWFFPTWAFSGWTHTCGWKICSYPFLPDLHLLI